MIKKIVQFPNMVQKNLIHTFEKIHYQSKNRPLTSPQAVDSTTLKELKKTITQQSVHKKEILSSLPDVEQTLIRTLKQKVKQANKNNVTRTSTYLEFFKKHPELHWALLAHLVSRNGGWNMTDLQGGLTDILKPERKQDFFLFLESANALIFHDAYPQLLLYEESKKQKRNLFYLLPYFHVSSFMKPIWDHFFTSNDSKVISIALIINEQHYIEKRIIQNNFYQEHVLDTLLFQAQELLQMTQVLFPFRYQEKKIRLAGFSIADFASISERIDIGKKLYAMLFGLTPLSEDIFSFAKEIPHTGSRSDYWPETFTTRTDVGIQGQTSCGVHSRIYSPSLKNAWNDVNHSFTNYRDWYSPGNSEVLTFFDKIETPTSFDITSNYCHNLQRMYMAALAYKKAEKWL